MDHVPHKTQDWISAVCSRFEQATGVTMRFERSAERHQSSRLTARWNRDVTRNGARVGRLLIAEDDLQDLDETDSRLILGVAEVMSDLVDGVVVQEDRQTQYSRMLTELIESTTRTAVESDPVRSINRLIQTVLRLTELRAVGFFLLNPEATALQLKASMSLDTGRLPQPFRLIEESPHDLQILQTGHTMIHRSRSPEDSRWLPGAARLGTGIRVANQGTPLGTLWAFDRRERELTEREQSVLESVGHQIAAVLERLVLKQDSLRKQAIQKELGLEKQVEQRFSNEQFSLPRGLTLSGFCSSRYEIGGDFFDAVRIDRHRVLLAIADACGNSVPAALISCTTRGALRSLIHSASPTSLSTATLMQGLNHVVYELMPLGRFITVVLALIDTRTRQLTITNAGHPAPIRLSPQGRPRVIENNHDLMLGAVAQHMYSEHQTSLERGEFLLLFTDGITEARNASRAMFRHSGIADVVRDRHWNSADEVLQAVRNELEIHTGATVGSDDCSLVVVRMN